MRPYALTVVTLLLAGCDSRTEDTAPPDGDADTDTDADGDTGQAAVWSSEQLETEASLTGVYTSGEVVVVVGDGETIWLYHRDGSRWDDLEAGIDGAALRDVWGTGSGYSKTRSSPTS